jgi:REP element-mobilizing transposase RayT
MAWRNISHAKHKCDHYLVWWPKRRRVLADAEVRTRVCETFRAIAEELGFGIGELNVGDNHVQLRLEILPKYSSARVVDILKSNSPNRAFRKFSWLRWKYWPQRTLGRRLRRPHRGFSVPNQNRARAPLTGAFVLNRRPWETRSWRTREENSLVRDSTGFGDRFIIIWLCMCLRSGGSWFRSCNFPLWSQKPREVVFAASLISPTASRRITRNAFPKAELEIGVFVSWLLMDQIVSSALNGTMQPGPSQCNICAPVTTANQTDGWRCVT